MKDTAMSGSSGSNPGEIGNGGGFSLGCVIGVIFLLGILGGGIFLISASQARRLANDVQTKENLRRLAAGILQFHEVRKTLPPVSESGLSWRVNVLPFLDAEELSRKYRRDEPWDSPLNIRLLSEVPEPFENKSRPGETGHITFQVIGGHEALFDGRPYQSIRNYDGFLLVDATRSVPWTQPADIWYEPAKPLPNLGDPMRQNRLIAAFTDGSVHCFENPQESMIRCFISASERLSIVPEKVD